MLRTFLTSFRWIHIGPDGDVEPYGGGPEVGGGPGAVPHHSGHKANLLAPGGLRPATPTTVQPCPHRIPHCISDCHGLVQCVVKISRAREDALQSVCVRERAGCNRGSCVSATRARVSGTCRSDLDGSLLCLLGGAGASPSGQRPCCAI